MDDEQTLQRQAEALHNRINALDRHDTAPYPEEIRRDVIAFVRRARNAEPAWTWSRVSEWLSISSTTLIKWQREDGPSEPTVDTQMVPVQLSAPSPPRGDDRAAGPRLCIGPDLVLEGVTVEEAVEAARRLRQ